MSVGLSNLGPIAKTFSKINKISQTMNEICFSCKNIVQISIWMILIVSKCSINDVKSPISLTFGGPQTPHITTIFEKFVQTILFYVNKSAYHKFGTICDTGIFPMECPCALELLHMVM